jgi:hypothetical protein
VRIEDGRFEDRALIPLLSARKGHYPRLRRIFWKINEGSWGDELSSDIRWSIGQTARSSKAVDH